MLVALPQVRAMRTRFTYIPYYTHYTIYKVRLFDVYKGFSAKKRK
jgi:hypothetical protein